MSNTINTIIKRDETDPDQFHVYVLTKPFSRPLKWLACSIHVDILGELTDEETLEFLKSIDPGNEEFIDLQINRIGDD